MKEQIFNDAIDFYGVNYQTDIAIEEMSELSKALLKYRRKPSEENKRNILEEMADVQITLSQLRLIHIKNDSDYSVFEKFFDDKVHRLSVNIDNEKKVQELSNKIHL